jgi:hypothetical protein
MAIWIPDAAHEMLYGTMESILAQEAVKDAFVKSSCKMNWSTYYGPQLLHNSAQQFSLDRNPKRHNILVHYSRSTFLTNTRIRTILQPLNTVHQLLYVSLAPFTPTWHLHLRLDLSIGSNSTAKMVKQPRVLLSPTTRQYIKEWLCNST